MAFDVALDKDTGDWLFSGNLDLQAVHGEDTVQQRLMTRLKIKRGWMNDPTDGLLGSRLREALRLPRPRALREARLYVEEALAPMLDIVVSNVELIELLPNTTEVLLRIEYQIISFGDISPIDAARSEFTVRIPLGG